MQNKTNLIILIIGLLAVFGLGFGVGKFSLPEPKEIKNQLVSDLEGKLESKIEKGLVFLGPIYGEKRARAILDGELIAIKENTLIVKAANSYQGGKFFDYLRESDYYEKTVKLEEDTEIVKLVPREIPETSQGILDETSPFSPELFFPFKEERASFSELEEGIRISVKAKSEFDLAETEEIFAQKIEIQEECLDCW